MALGIKEVGVALDVSARLFLTGERVEKTTINGGRLIMDFPQETLDLFRRAADRSGYSLEEVITHCYTWGQAVLKAGEQFEQELAQRWAEILSSLVVEMPADVTLNAVFGDTQGGT